jgi:hypothetical protein
VRGFISTVLIILMFVIVGIKCWVNYRVGKTFGQWMVGPREEDDRERRV